MADRDAGRHLSVSVASFSHFRYEGMDVTARA
jgi:hypothetical protein